MNRTVLDLWVGFFVAIGLAALMFLSLKVGNLSSAHMSETYTLQAKFDNIGGLKVRGPVKSAGVVVGRISDIRFDVSSYEAVVTRVCLVSSMSGWMWVVTRKCCRRVRRLPRHSLPLYLKN